MSKALRQPRVLALLFGSFALLALMAISVTISLVPSKALARDGTPVTTGEVQAILLRAGLDAEALTAAAIIPEVAGEATLAAAEEAVAAITAIRSADAAFATADAEHNRLLELVRTRRATEQDTEDLATATATLVTATSNRNAAIAVIRDAAFEELSSPQREALTSIAANRHKGGTLAMAVASRTEAQWVVIRNALANERISNENEVAPDGEMQTLLEDVRDDNAVSAAQAALNTSLTNVTNAWNSAISQALPG